MGDKRLFHEWYDTIFAKKDYAREVETVLQMGGVLNGSEQILELGSGTGSHTQCLASRGYSVTAVDTDEEMVAIARRKLAALPAEAASRITYHYGRVEDIPAATFDLAIALFNVVNYISDVASLESLMREVARRLKPGASFVLDAWNGRAALLDPPTSKTTVIEAGCHRIKVDLECHTDSAALRTDMTYSIEVSASDGGEPDREKFSMAHFLWPPDVVVEMAHRAGLEAKSIHPLFDTSRHASDRDWKLMFHFRKPLAMSAS